MAKRNLIVDISGLTFGRLKVLRISNKRMGRAAMWICRCECGNRKEIAGYVLRSGKTKSCGCLRDQRARETMTIHGLSYGRIYRIRRNMIQRCTNPKNPMFHRYGGRGIKICRAWSTSAKAFYEWAMSHGYADNLTIERKNNDGNYCPSNCIWIPKGQQALNTILCKR